MEKVPAEFLEDAIHDLSEISDELRSITAAGPPSLPPLLAKKLFRVLHTIKGSAQTFGLNNEAKLAHDVESFLTAFTRDRTSWDARSESVLMGALETLTKNFVLISEDKDPIPSAGLSEKLAAFLGNKSAGKVSSLPDNFPVEFSDRLSHAEMNMLGSMWETGEEILILEFAIAQNEFAAKFKQIREELENEAGVIAVLPGQTVENKTIFRFLIASGNRYELIPIVSGFKGKVLFQKQKDTNGEGSALDESANDELAETILHGKKAAALLGKKVKFRAAKDRVKIPRSLYKIASTILLHLVRNAVDHGIEFPLERAALKKPAQGNIEIAVSLTETDLLISVCDDGRGIENAADIFAAGYSTAPFVTELSGRGVGLDSVRDSVQKANGTVKVDSKPGHGASFEISLPLPEK